MERVDFFISYRGGDVSWAEWIAWTLESAGYTTIVQAWDFDAGRNVILAMDEATKQAERTLLVLSPRYFTSAYTAEEWSAKLAEGLAQGRNTLLPVKVAPCDVKGLLGAHIWVELIGLDKAAAHERLLQAARRERRKPTVEPHFPGDEQAAQTQAATAPGFPGNLPVLWHMPPHRNPDFSGREDLLNLIHTRLGEGHPLALHGLGGVGKTQLAAEFAYRYAAEYDLVWWLRAADPATFTQECLALAEALGLKLEDAAQAPTRVRRELEARARAASRWLLILDDAPGPETWLCALIPSAPGGHGHTLITTRHPDWPGVAHEQDVRVWSKEEAAAFLAQQTGLEDPAGAAALAEVLGRLPLALAQAAAYMRASGVSYAQYVTLFETRTAELWARERSPADYPATVATTWSVAMDRAGDTPGARELLNLCAMLAPDDLPLDLLPPHAASLPEPLAGVAADPLKLADAAAALRRYALLQGEGGRWAVHALVQLVARQALPPEERAAWARATVALLLAACPDDIQTNVAGWPLCARLLPHGLSAARWAEDFGAIEGSLGALLGALGMYLQYCVVTLPGAHRLLDRALQIGEKVWGRCSPVVAVRANNVGLVLKAIGDLSGAREALERALRIDEQVYGPEHPNVAIRVNNLGSVLQDLGDLLGAQAAFERALRIDEQVYGVDHPIVAACLNNLAALLREQGDSLGARVTLGRVLCIEERMHGLDDPRVAEVLNNLGSVLCDLDDLPGAQAALERSLAISEKCYGCDHPNLVPVLSNIGLVLAERGNLLHSRSFYERAMSIGERSLGSAHFTIGPVASGLGLVLWEMCDLTGARTYLERALRIDEGVYGTRHPNVAIDLNNLGKVLQDQGDLLGAHAAFARAVCIGEESYGREHPAVAQFVGNLGALHEQSGALCEARRCYLRALLMLSKRLGEAHSLTQMTRAALEALDARLAGA